MGEVLYEGRARQEVARKPEGKVEEKTVVGAKSS